MSDGIEYKVANETHVREWFAAHCTELGYRIVVSQAGFPDYVLRDRQGKQLRVEAEYQSASFLQHGHDPAGCDAVVCWQHTVTLPFPVLELSTGITHDANAVVTVEQAYIKGKKRLAAREPTKEGRRVLEAFKRSKAEFEQFVFGLMVNCEVTAKWEGARAEAMRQVQFKADALTAALGIPSMHPYELLAVVQLLRKGNGNCVNELQIETE